MTVRRKRAFVKDAIRFTENPMNISTKSLPCEKHSKDIYSIPLIREHQQSFLEEIHYKTCESNFADVPFTVVFYPFENKNTGKFFRGPEKTKRYLITDSECIVTFSVEISRNLWFFSATGSWLRGISWMKQKMFHLDYLNWVQIKFGGVSHLKFLPNKITRSITASRPTDHKTDEIHSIPSIITEENCEKNHKKSSAGFQSETWTVSVTLTLDTNNT